MILQDSLKPREIEVLRLITDGLSNREISEQLFISVETVKWYNKQIYSKLDVSGRKEAAHKAQQLGLLDDSIQSDMAVATAKNNLPQETTPFIGRTHELDAIQTLLQDAENRLLTILAPGGMGKTRLSLKVAQSQIGHYPDGIFFIPLAPLSSPNDIVTTIAENIGFVFHGEQTLTQQIVTFLKDRTMLLVLDNFEHLLEGASLVSDIVKLTQNINIVITSRERLNLHGENVYSLRGLEFPEWETPADALEYDAVKLFMSSAQRTRTDFDLHDDDLDYLARICKLTAGMPLGIELAAGWVDALSLEQIANEI
jgi:DNA-binding CsgD family transcriptional regulator